MLSDFEGGRGEWGAGDGSVQGREEELLGDIDEVITDDLSRCGQVSSGGLRYWGTGVGGSFEIGGGRWQFFVSIKPYDRGELSGNFLYEYFLRAIAHLWIRHCFINRIVLKL